MRQKMLVLILSCIFGVYSLNGENVNLDYVILYIQSNIYIFMLKTK